MSTTDSPINISAFFDSYRTAFERRDAAAVADHFAYPGHVTSDTGDIVLVPITDRQEWIGKVEQLLGMYQAIGVDSARVLDLTVTEISPRLIQAHVHWALHTAAGERLYDFEAIYTVANVGGEFHIVAIAHNEMPQYRACYARLKAQRAA
jgi:hypothetical protein